MMPLFNIVRYAIYGTVIAWTIIVLSVAAFLDHILVPSDLTRFVPLAIFVASTTLFILIALLIFGVLKSSTLVSQTRSELAAVGLLGVLWLALGVYTTTQELADVECDDEISYSTSTYHAQYHVLQAFSIFNVILLWSFLIFFLFLSLRHHFAGRREVWTSKAVDYPWFGPAKTIAAQQTARSRSQNQGKGKGNGYNHGAGLPLPATAKEKSGRSGGRHERNGSGERREKYGGGPKVVPPEVPTKGGHTYVVFIPPAANNNAQLQNQIYPSRR